MSDLHFKDGLNPHHSVNFFQYFSYVIMVAFEGSENIATKLLSMQHCRQWVVGSLSNQSLQVLTVVSDGAKYPSVAESE